MGENFTRVGPENLGIYLAPGAEEAGMASMMAEMISTNLQNKPERIKDYNALRGTIWVTAGDAGVDITLAFTGGGLIVHNGKVGHPIIHISTDSSTLMELANITIKYGMPYYFDDVGKMVLNKLKTGELKIRGMVPHIAELTRLTKIMSVK